ncbi:MAG: xylulokinase [Nitrososphaeria archaeon]
MSELRPPFLLSIDCGTGACKTVVFDLEGRQVFEASAEYPIYHPKVTWAEQDPDEWWAAAVRTVSEATREVSAKEIAAVAVDSQREAVVPMDKEGRKLANSMIWLDERAMPQQKQIEKLISKQRVLDITGVPVDYIFSAPKILWIKENQPSVYDQTACFLCAKDFIVFRLTGQRVTDYTMASRTMLFDIRKLKWSQEICEAINIPIELLPDTKGSWETVGEVDAQASRLTGLRKGTVVIGGGGDRPCEALGAGAIREGLVNIGTGTGTVFEVPVSRPRPDSHGRIDCCSHVVPSLWEYEVIVNATGGSLRWFRDNFGVEEGREGKRTGRSAYELLDDLATNISPGSDGLFYYPYLWGARAPKFNPAARGVFFGLTHAHTKAHFVRSILEGVAFQYAEILEILQELGVSVERFSMTGGETRSGLWSQIKANVIGKPIGASDVPDAAPLGAAILAAVGTKQYHDFDEATKNMVRTSETFQPKKESYEKYRNVLSKYKTAYEALESAFLNR